MEVKWIKLNTDMFDNSKIRYIRTLPSGNDIVLIWVMLLTKAGKCNSNGYIFLTESIPYSPEMLGAELGFETSMIVLALTTFQKLNMIQLEEQKIYVNGWLEHQNIDGLEKIREQTRNRMAKYRANKKALKEGYATSDVTVTESYATDKNKKENRKDIDKNRVNSTSNDDSSNKLQPIIQAWNNLNLNRLISINQGTNRHKLLQARLKDYGMDKVIQAINNIKLSKFLTGQNNKGWVITFDWLVKPNNFIKVLEQNYSDKEVQNDTRYNAEDKFANFKPKAPKTTDL